MKDLEYRHVIPNECMRFEKNPVLHAKRNMLVPVSIKLLELRELLEDSTITLKWSETMVTELHATELSLNVHIETKGGL